MTAEPLLRPSPASTVAHPAIGLVCPRCRSPLLEADGASQLICSGAACGRVFPVVDGTPILIHDENSVFAIADFTRSRRSGWFFRRYHQCCGAKRRHRPTGYARRSAGPPNG